VAAQRLAAEFARKNDPNRGKARAALNDGTMTAHRAGETNEGAFLRARRRALLGATAIVDGTQRSPRTEHTSRAHAEVDRNGQEPMLVHGAKVLYALDVAGGWVSTASTQRTTNNDGSKSVTRQPSAHASSGTTKTLPFRFTEHGRTGRCWHFSTGPKEKQHLHETTGRLLTVLPSCRVQFSSKCVWKAYQVMIIKRCLRLSKTYNTSQTRLSSHLAAMTGQPVEEFPLPEVTYDALAFKAIGFTQPSRDPSKPINLMDYRLVLKYRDEHVRDETWWVRIRDTEHLVRIVEEGARTRGILRVSASVLNVKPMAAAAPVKRVAMPKEAPAVRAPPESTDWAPDAPISAALPKPQKRVATGEATDDRSPKRLAAPLTLPSVTPSTTSEVETQQTDDKVLAALFFFNSLQITSPPRIQVALMSGYSNIKSAGFSKAASRLKDEGYISSGNGTMSLTTKGKQCKSDMPNPPTDNEDVHRRFKSLLTPTCARMFDLLADGKAHKKLDLMADLDYTNEKVRL
jgi:hypothetical protein